MDDQGGNDARQNEHQKRHHDDAAAGPFQIKGGILLMAAFCQRNGGEQGHQRLDTDTGHHDKAAGGSAEEIGELGENIHMCLLVC